MKKQNKKFHTISNLRQLQRNKYVLSKKIKIREKLLKRRLKNFQATITPEFVYEEALKTAKMQDSVLKFIPQLLKMKIPQGAGAKLGGMSGDSKKQMLIGLFSGLGASITSMFAFRNRKTSKQKDKYPDEQMFI